MVKHPKEIIADAVAYDTQKANLERNLTIKIARMSQQVNSMLPKLEDFDNASDYVEDLNCVTTGELSELVCAMQDLAMDATDAIDALEAKQTPFVRKAAQNLDDWKEAREAGEVDLRTALDIELGNS